MVQQCTINNIGLGPHSRLGAKLLGIRVMYMLVLYSCGTKTVIKPFSTAVPFGGQIAWNWSIYVTAVHRGTKTVINPFRTALPFRGQISWNYS